jgi:hypothetical protein
MLAFYTDGRTTGLTNIVLNHAFIIVSSDRVVERLISCFKEADVRVAR